MQDLSKPAAAQRLTSIPWLREVRVKLHVKLHVKSNMKLHAALCWASGHVVFSADSACVLTRWSLRYM